MRLIGVALMGFVLLRSVPVAAMNGEVYFYRDWMVEAPLTAGVVNGVSLGLMVGRRYGELPAPVKWEDPSSISADTHRWLAGQYRHLWVLGNAVGALLLVSGLFGSSIRIFIRFKRFRNKEGTGSARPR